MKPTAGNAFRGRWTCATAVEGIFNDLVYVDLRGVKQRNRDFLVSNVGTGQSQWFGPAFLRSNPEYVSRRRQATLTVRSSPQVATHPLRLGL
jgi:hypothetical protein